MFFCSPQIVVNSFMKLTSLSLYGTTTNEEITIELFTRIAHQKDLKLKRLNFGYAREKGSNESRLSVVEPYIFAKAVSRLKEVSLQHSNLTSKQLKLMFRDLAKKKSRIEALSLSFDMVETTMNTGLIVEALKNVQDVDYKHMLPDYFDHFINWIMIDPDVTTRYISVEFGDKTYQERLEEALSMNPHINFYPHRTKPRMLGWTDVWADCENEEFVEYGIGAMERMMDQAMYNCHF